MNFQQIFKSVPEATASAPGRVNLLGEHTDYNDGFVLPTAIPQQTIVHIGYSSDDRHHFYSENLEEQVDVDRDELPRSDFARYIYGCIQVLTEQGYTVPPVSLYVTSTVPIGSGLSSSAALEVATLRSLRSLLSLAVDDVKIAQLGQQAEIKYAGVNCGILDQMACSLADLGNMLFLDTRTLDRQLLPFPSGTEIVVIDSGVARSLASSGYNQRRAECEEAAQQLGVTALRDISDPQLVETLPEPLNRRARHVVTENNRVLRAIQDVSPEEFGELMNLSHASLRNDYEVSVPALDQLVNILQATSGVFGARLTGAGFGGACVALVAARESRAIATSVINQYSDEKYRGHILVG
jgi:galactokinase